MKITRKRLQEILKEELAAVKENVYENEEEAAEPAGETTPDQDIENIRKDLEDSAAAAKGTGEDRPKKSSAAMTGLKGAIGAGGIYQAVQALKGLGDIGSDALAKILSKMDPEMVDIINQIGDAAGQLFEEQSIQEQ